MQLNKKIFYGLLFLFILNYIFSFNTLFGSNSFSLIAFIAGVVGYVGLPAGISFLFGSIAKRMTKNKEKEHLESVMYKNASLWILFFLIISFLSKE